MLIQLNLSKQFPSYTPTHTGKIFVYTKPKISCSNMGTGSTEIHGETLADSSIRTPPLTQCRAQPRPVQSRCALHMVGRTQQEFRAHLQSHAWLALVRSGRCTPHRDDGDCA